MLHWPNTFYAKTIGFPSSYCGNFSLI